ncbi:hypothetical protein DPM19_29520 [Actinomadura craniellae]|uniref:Uncharacterized protein n=1 Tax=Actinomadura craniellae TaxID=2231787 RepID=A0A365GX92_9ACTN|nr:hypothetical protein DPM19_29520 [Actinomadura craniellae]
MLVLARCCWASLSSASCCVRADLLGTRTPSGSGPLLAGRSAWDILSAPLAWVIPDWNFALAWASTPAALPSSRMSPSANSCASPSHTSVRRFRWAFRPCSARSKACWAWAYARPMAWRAPGSAPRMNAAIAS